ncbi:GGDEF domain-containing protein [Paracoccus liaowanqingii]|uniref:diguanylate cyclase n=2 Tax=Paracoccus liaowanqingii TaxID=2560053 RepID=A0A4Z1BYH6_9RHOB|nr:GGDEF domain-containing protein [Paracoccus liaowanqingii]
MCKTSGCVIVDSTMQQFLILVNTLGVMSICTVVYSLLQRQVPDRVLRALFVGLSFGAAAMVVMVQPIYLAPGIQADTRGAFVGMAMAFGGPLAAAVTVTLAILTRLLIGGQGALTGVVVILATAACAGLWFAVYRSARKRNWQAWILLSVASSLPTYLALHRYADTGEQLKVFLAMLIGALMICFGKMLETEQRRGRRERELARAAATDALTGLPNRRALENYTRELEEAGAQDVTLLLLDVDHFKRINDDYGHDEGDRVLQGIAAAIKGTIREGDFAARIGGEEFAVVVRTNDISTGQQVAERFRQAVQVPYGPPSERRISTISVGGFSFNRKPFSYLDGYKLADLALYQSKAEGRNRATITPYLQAA